LQPGFARVFAAGVADIAVVGGVHALNVNDAIEVAVITPVTLSIAAARTAFSGIRL
jgi:hypothetical protein